MATIIKKSNPEDTMVMPHAKIPKFQDVPVMMNGEIQRIPPNRITYVYHKCKRCLLYFREKSDLQTHPCNPAAVGSTMALYNLGPVAPVQQKDNR